MRTEEEMFDLILGFAKNDERIRVVGMEGSRTNPNAPRDKFQDYDISYLVSDMDSFLADHSWVDIFGQRIIMQMPEAMTSFPNDLGNWFSYLMLFEDGNRIDLTLIPVEEKDKYLHGDDKLLAILLDKDNLVGAIPPATDEDYHVKCPSKAYYDDCCNEFLWVSTYVAKGLWRKEILFANYHLNELIRPCLLKMLAWKVGINTNFSLSVGKSYKYLEPHLSTNEWQSLLDTYNLKDNECCWESLFQMCELFKATATYVGEKLGFAYPILDDQKVIQYLNEVHLDSLKS